MLWDHQMREVTYRIFEQYWRTPSYLYSKLALYLISSLFVGFVFFDAATTQRGLQNQMFSIFVNLTILQQLSQQIMPHFVTQRSLYEARERQSKTYSWQAFILSNILVEICWNSLVAVVIFFCYYYPVGLYQNAQHTDQVHLRGALYFLFLLQFMLLGLNVHEHDYCWHADCRRRSQHSQSLLLSGSGFLRCSGVA